MNRKNRARFSALAIVVALLLSSAVASYAQQPVVVQQQQGAPQQAPPQGQQPPRPPAAAEKSFADSIKDMKVIEGLFTFYFDPEENKLLMEIQPDQFDKIFLFAATVDRTVGERGLYASQVSGTMPFYFQRLGKTVRLFEKNTGYTAKPGTPEGRSVAKSFMDSMIATAKIASKPHPEKKSILVDPAELFVNDLPGWAPDLNQIYSPTIYRFDRPNSNIGPVKAFPNNVLLEVWLHYVTDNPRAPTLTLADSRSIPIVMKYELSSMPESDYKPRVGDDRLGYFMTFRQDYTSNVPGQEDMFYIRRWNLQKQDPNAPLSPPKKQLVYWLENTIPVEYRDAFREGVLLWNKAFEKVGIKDAIAVKQMPDDADWDPADTRYNTIRWFHGVGASFAIGPSRANPFTGELLDADIGFSDGIIRAGARRAGRELVYPVTQGSAEAIGDRPRGVPMLFGKMQDDVCTYADELAEQAAFGLDILEIRGEMTPELEKDFMHQYIVEVTAHEVGHTLGLRHNFIGSQLLKPSQLNDVSITSKMGQSGSVMDYNPIVLAVKGQKQGHYMPTTIGPYDYLVIEYGYKPIAGDEKAALGQIAARAAEHGNSFSTDGEALGGSPTSIDPRVFLFDQSDDPLAYNRDRIGIVKELWANAESKLVNPGDGYQILRRSVNRGMGEYNRSLSIPARLIGGIYHNRDHVGDPKARMPYTPVPAEKQREALDFLRANAFSEKAFVLPAGMNNKLALEFMPQLTTTPITRLDYPWHDQVLGLQAGVLNRLYNAAVLKRMVDNELLFGANEKPFTMAELFSGLDSAIWSELGTPGAKIPAMRRNLQREQVRLLIRLVMRPPVTLPPQLPPGFVPPPQPPADATTLARASLVSLQAKIRGAMASATDRTTRAHLEETNARIDAALKAQMDKPLE